MQASLKSRTRSSVINFYWRKLFFFGGLFLLVGLWLSNISTYRADIQSYQPPIDSGNLTLQVAIDQKGSILVDGKKLPSRVTVLSDQREEARFPIIENPGRYFSQVTISVTLPQPVARNVEYQLVTSHGVGKTDAYLSNSTTVVFVAYDVEPTALITPVVIMPKGTIGFPLISEINNFIHSIKADAWVITGLALPSITLIFMFIFIGYQTRRQKIDMPDEETPAPPMAIPPAVVGAIMHQKVGPREIAATLIDLAVRKDIFIIDRDRDFAFIKNKFDRRLLAFEKILLSKIFRTKLISSKKEVEHRINNHLYSRKMSLVTSGIYTLATRLGYFRVNPRFVHIKYQMIGLFLFFSGLAGFLLTLKYYSGPAFVAFFWVGMMISALVISLTAKNIPIRTLLGQEAVSNWLAFKKYLTSKTKIEFSYDNLELFQKYLPYAVVLECETAWAKRFSEQNFMVPEWFMTDKTGLGMSDFCLSLFPIVSYVGRSLANIQEPSYR